MQAHSRRVGTTPCRKRPEAAAREHRVAGGNQALSDTIWVYCLASMARPAALLKTRKSVGKVGSRRCVLC
jgi:hypothetical protein